MGEGLDEWVFGWAGEFGWVGGMGSLMYERWVNGWFNE